MKIKKANRIAPDGTPQNAASHLGLFCLPMTHKKDAKLIRVIHFLLIYAEGTSNPKLVKNYAYLNRFWYHSFRIRKLEVIRRILIQIIAADMNNSFVLFVV